MDNRGKMHCGTEGDVNTGAGLRRNRIAHHWAWLIVACASLLLAGCWATTDAPTRWAQLPESQRAAVFGTITAEMGGPSGPMSRYMLKYRNVETKEEAWLSINPGMDSSGDPELYERRRTVGTLFDVSLPAGRYEFFDVWFVAATGFGSTEYRAREPFSVPFTIEAGTLNYLGEFRAYPIVGRNLLGMSLPGGGYFVVLDRERRDTQLLAKRRGVPFGPVKNIVPDPDRANTPFMRRAPLPPFNSPPQG